MVRTIVCKAVRAEVPKFYFEFAGEHREAFSTKWTRRKSTPTERTAKRGMSK